MEESIGHDEIVHSHAELTSIGSACPPSQVLSISAPPAAGRKGLARLRPAIKRSIDFYGAALLLILTAPVMLIVALLILIDDGWPFLYAHPRVGRGGRTFNCLKFRTMRRDGPKILSELLATNPDLRAEWVITGKFRQDPRLTRTGTSLRSTSLDELPQLLNVLRGDMSLVGPRPIVRKELEDFYIPLGGAPAYLAIRPGLTGLWQISGRSNVAYADRVRLDTEYAARPSLRADATILMRTIKVVLSRNGAY